MQNKPVNGNSLSIGEGIHWDAGNFSWALDDEALVMAVLNVTPDSFSDGGRHFRIEDTLASAARFVSEGAAILDVGGESTRPNASVVEVKEELARVIPVIERLSGSTAAAISVDTSKPEVAGAALGAGANIVNDITGFRDPRMVEICAGSNCGLVVMHMQGTPQTMQENPQYLDVVEEVVAFFNERMVSLERAGIKRSRVVLDPGIGFGKTLEHNLALLAGLERLRAVGRPILIGLSRKSFLGLLLEETSILEREVPTLAMTCLTRSFGAMIHRVHSVRECHQAVRMMEELFR